MKSTCVIKIIIIFIVSAICTCSIAYYFGMLYIPQKNSILSSHNTTVSMNYRTVIIDAGHGGEDGGTSSGSGLIEKDVNLSIAQMLCDMLKLNGINVVMTRTDDRLLYDRNVDFQGRKKKLDLAARVAIANSTMDAIFVSIHMNSFTDQRYSGMQVWYSPNNPMSYTLAEQMQENNRNMLQPTNNRRSFCATSAINVLYNAKCPAVLVECGFLSNPGEAALFENEDYRQKVAFILYSSIMDFLVTDKSPQQ